MIKPDLTAQFEPLNDYDTRLAIITEIRDGLIMAGKEVTPALVRKLYPKTFRVQFDAQVELDALRCEIKTQIRRGEL